MIVNLLKRVNAYVDISRNGIIIVATINIVIIIFGRDLVSNTVTSSKRL